MTSAGGAPVRVIQHTLIPLSDGTNLAAKIWLPDDTSTPVPGILEYLPYRKRDLTSVRDNANLPYVAGRGYACVRVDLRGAGDSDGLMLDEYLKQEQDDGIEVIAWIAKQEWCTGSVGMIGISWGGFNGLQIAARRPPQLKAIITLCSTDDRYDNDVHFQGGAILLENFSWACCMIAINGTPPDPALVGDKWRDMWLKRLNVEPYMAEWHRRQRRDEYWQHASICEDYSDVQCPTYLVGGWRDPYPKAALRMFEHLKCPKKALIGHWAHHYPNLEKGFAGPSMGFLQESVRWWDKWLKGIDNDIMDEPPVRAYMCDTVPPMPHYEHRPGNWVAHQTWPDPDNINFLKLNMSPGLLSEKDSATAKKLSICSPGTVGLAAGRYASFGLHSDEPLDQRKDAGGSLNFDTEPLENTTSILGRAVLKARVASDKPVATLTAVLSEVLPDGAVMKVAYGILNLTHRNSDIDLEKLEPGQFYDIELKLNDCGQNLSAGSRIRLALSTQYFPMIWPTPENVTLTVDCAASSFNIPVRTANPLDAKLKSFEPVAPVTPMQVTSLREPENDHTVTEDVASRRVTTRLLFDRGLNRFEDGWRQGWKINETSSIIPDDPLSAFAEQRFLMECGYDDLLLNTEGYNKMSVDKDNFLIDVHVDAYENEKSVFSRDWSWKIPRDHV